MELNKNNSTIQEEISLKELVLIIKSHLGEVIKYWWLPLGLSLIMAVLAFYVTSKKEVTYQSVLTFSLEEEDSGGGISALAGGLLGSFGFGGGGNANVGKMLQMAKSRNSVNKVLLTKIQINGKNDYVANHIMRSEDVYVFRDKEELDTFFFTTPNTSYTDIIPNKALVKIWEHLVGNKKKKGIIKLKLDDNTGIVSMESEFKSEDLAVEFPLLYFNEVQKFYIDKKTNKHRNTYNIIKSKYDSITTIINSLEYKAAQMNDSKRNIILTTKNLDKLRAEKDLRILYAQLPEVTKNKELAEYTLNTLTPSVQAIDTPVYPIKPTKPSVIKNTAIGIILGCILAVAFIVFRKVLRDIMSDDDTKKVATAA